MNPLGRHESPHGAAPILSTTFRSRRTRSDLAAGGRGHSALLSDHFWHRPCLLKVVDNPTATNMKKDSLEVAAVMTLVLTNLVIMALALFD